MSEGSTGTGSTSEGWGRTLVFVYGIFAFSATGRSSYQLVTKGAEAPLPYALSALAAVVYAVAAWALATGRRSVAVVAVAVELVGILTIGTISAFWPEDFHDDAGNPVATVWSDFGSGYGYVPLLLPFVGLWWLWRTRPHV